SSRRRHTRFKCDWSSDVCSSDLLMKLDVLRPKRVIDINDLGADLGAVELRPEGLHLGALVRMAEAADHPLVRQYYPVIAQSLERSEARRVGKESGLGMWWWHT